MRSSIQIGNYFGGEMIDGRMVTSFIAVRTYEDGSREAGLARTASWVETDSDGDLVRCSDRWFEWRTGVMESK